MPNKLIIAVDFDGTLCEMKWPGIGKPNLRLISVLIKMREAGNDLILWTCRETENLDSAIEWCKSFGLHFDKVNEDSDSSQWEPGRKVVADIYIDDRAFTPDGFCNFFDQLLISGFIK